jgi:adenosylcobinamide-phosphate synthase
MDIPSLLIQTAPLTLPLVAGYLLDLLFGDPYHWPHPVKVFGNLISRAEHYLNKGSKRLLKGALMTIVLVTLVWAVLHFLFQVLTLTLSFIPYLYYPVATIMVFWGLANRNLIDEAKKVERVLTNEGTEAGRRQLSYIVGRDTSQLTPTQIRTAVLETLSENLSDGVIAPLFYYLIGGIPLMFAYKMINTLDSMTGYKSDRYRRFGRFAARLDDVANFVPARLTAILMIAVSMSGRGLRFIFKFGHQHASPNAGYPESALAGILDCRFGGPNVYYGQLVQKPYIGHKARELTKKDLNMACTINHRATLLLMVLTLLLLLLCRQK